MEQNLLDTLCSDPTATPTGFDPNDDFQRQSGLLDIPLSLGVLDLVA